MSEEPTSASSGMSTLRAFQVVAWSFFGIRKGSEFQKDVTQVTPAQVILVGIVSGVLFVMSLVLVVNLIV